VCSDAFPLNNLKERHERNQAKAGGDLSKRMYGQIRHRSFPREGRMREKYDKLRSNPLGRCCDKHTLYFSLVCLSLQRFGEFFIED
jgi:hypothetical protein